MAKMVAQVKGLAELQKRFSDAPDIVTRIFQRAVGKALLILEGGAKQIAPIDTGFLVNSISSNLFKTTIGGAVIAAAPYASYVHEGTAQWPITVAPKNSSRVRQFFTGALENKQQETDRVWEEAARQVVDELAS